jgi:hypothetical protein
MLEGITTRSGRKTTFTVANLYLVTNVGSAHEVTADFYERQGEDWAFILRGDEVYRIKIDDVLSIAKAGRDPVEIV